MHLSSSVWYGIRDNSDDDNGDHTNDDGWQSIHHHTEIVSPRCWWAKHQHFSGRYNSIQFNNFNSASIMIITCRMAAQFHRRYSSCFGTERFQDIWWWFGEEFGPNRYDRVPLLQMWPLLSNVMACRREMMVHLLSQIFGCVYNIPSPSKANFLCHYGICMVWLPMNMSTCRISHSWIECDCSNSTSTLKMEYRIQFPLKKTQKGPIT